MVLGVLSMCILLAKLLMLADIVFAESEEEEDEDDEANVDG